MRNQLDKHPGRLALLEIVFFIAFVIILIKLFQIYG